MYCLGLSYVYPMDNGGTSFVDPKDKKYRRITIKEVEESKRCSFDFSEGGDIIKYLFIVDIVCGKAIDYFNFDVARPQIKDSCVWLSNIEELVIDIKSKIKKYEYEKRINNMICRTERIVNMWLDKKVSKICDNMETQEEEIKLIDPIYLAIHNATMDFASNMRSNHNIDIPLNVAKVIDCLEELIDEDLLTKETLRALDELEAEENEKIEDVCKQKDELMTLLGACETYEQEIEILLARKIIDNDFNIIV